MAEPSPSALSVDLFDTLLLRATAQPADVFLRVCVRALDRGLVYRHVTPTRFQVLRQAAEEAARAAQRTRSGSSEVTLLEIYAQMLPGVLAASTEALVTLEADVERELLYPHPRTLDAVLAARKHGLRTALLSDTYFNVEEVMSLLRAARIEPEAFDEILTSSQERASKQRHDTGEEDTREHLRLESLRYGSPSPELTSLRRLSYSLAGNIGEDERWWFGLGASVLGPLLAAFADWVVEECVRDGIRVIRPLMREGTLFAQMITAAARRTGARLDVRPLSASHASTRLASIHRFEDVHARQLLQRHTLTVHEALATLGLSAHDAPDALRASAGVRLGAASQTILTDGDTLEEVLVRYLVTPDVRAAVERQAADARDLLRKYIQQECGSAADVAVVEPGFTGTTGAALAQADAGRRFHQFFLFGAEAVTRLWRDGHDVRVFAAGPIDHADLAGPIVRHPAVLEALLATGGTTRYYRAAELGVVPQLQEPRTPPDQQRAAANCRAGILVFQDRWLAWRQHRPRAAAAVAAARRLLTSPVHRLLTIPTPEEASRLGRLLPEDSDGGSMARPITNAALAASAPSASAFIASTLDAGALDRSCLWPAGVCEERWPGEIERLWRLAAGASDDAPAAIPSPALRAREAGVFSPAANAAA